MNHTIPFKSVLRGSEFQSDELPDESLFCNMPSFLHMLRIERKRSERSKRNFLLLLADITAFPGRHHPETVKEVIACFSLSLRETDIRGWYDEGHIIGVIFTEIDNLNHEIIEKIIQKIRNQLQRKFGLDRSSKIKFTPLVFPEDSGITIERGRFNRKLYPDLAPKTLTDLFSISIKEAIDFTGSLIAVLLFAPLFLFISAAIKLTSPGPVFFRQERMGLNGKIFTVLKFRSMYTDAGTQNHQEFIKKFIAGQEDNEASQPGVFKIQNDPRVTPIGQWLRKTSLDELPQFINVLKGDMSLVGPRPPIPYEFELYDYWHRRRLLSCKPGITGLWQITGRSSTSFDEMVRLDLKYISERSLLFDLKILFKTPLAVILGKGAY